MWDEPTSLYQHQLDWHSGIPGLTMDWREIKDSVVGTDIAVGALPVAALLIAIATSELD
jgi:hypothetical protein